MINKTILVLILANLLVIGACIQAQSTEKFEVSVAQVKGKLDAGEDIVLLDVRTESEYTGSLGHVDSSLLIPLNKLEGQLEQLEKYRKIEIIVICRSGNRSGYATKILRENNFKAFNMLGGMIAWNNMIIKEKDE